MLDQAAPSTVIAVGAYIPEESYGSLDLSMPKYNTDAANEIISAPGSKIKVKESQVVVKEGEDPAKAAARAQKEAEKQAAKAKKYAEVKAKMEAKKAERAAYQSR